ncbi:hypothetical protein MIND_01379800 [Mycena indigotica]|uniref:Uncharacterized protein n=1 Tax=Mycena indigotica TaxID=2126181 RepID=A0A8H6VPD3_9AGAR|nr:uncharacterized protein MIND_01379800 [Mycena indigotica]KAF7289187.1 hypothetical protein MIND_01379800 [Mycena indigotica]
MSRHAAAADKGRVCRTSTHAAPGRERGHGAEVEEEEEDAGAAPPRTRARRRTTHVRTHARAHRRRRRRRRRPRHTPDAATIKRAPTPHVTPVASFPPSTTMPLAKRARRSDEEVYDQRIADARQDPARLQALTRPLAGTVHNRKLSPAGEYIHERVAKLWKLFLQKRISGPEGWAQEIVQGSAIPTDDIFKEFIRFLSVVIVGRLAEFATKKTIKSYLYIFFALWKRKTFELLPKILRTKAIDFISHPEFTSAIRLSTAARAKEHGDVIDLVIILKALFTDTTCCRTHRFRLMMMYQLVIIALSSERPGALVESAQYRGTNQALLWRDHAFWLIPNPAREDRPLLGLLVTCRLLKGFRENDSVNKHFFILQEPDSHRMVDGLMYALTLALADNIFQDVSSIEEILRPKVFPTRAIQLRIRHDKLDLPVLRKEMIIDGKWSVDHTFAVPYSWVAGRLKRITLRAGFQTNVTFYSFRRGTANRIDAEVSEEERRMLMGHASGSDQFFSSYKSRISTVDLGNVLVGRNEVDDGHVLIMKTVTGLARGLDPKAPLKLTAAESTALESEPELVELRAKKQAALDLAAEERKKLAQIDDDDEDEHQRQSNVVADALQVARVHGRKHHALVSTETELRLTEKRRLFFEEAPFRELNGIDVPQRPPMAAIPTNTPSKRIAGHVAVTSGKENVIGLRRRLPRLGSAIDEVLAIITNFIVDNDDQATHLVESVNGLLSLPAQPSPLCYPGEGPTPEGHCPFCDIEISSKTHAFDGANMATHIHKCMLNDVQLKATQQLSVDFIPQSCRWKPCRQRETIWTSRDDFARHVFGHVQTAKNAGWSSGGKALCRWLEDDSDVEICGETECDEEHFGCVHGLNVWPKVRVVYDVITSETFVDLDGNGDEYRDQCLEHYARLFEPFATRGDIEVDFSTPGVTFTDEATNCITFDNGEGLGGERPEFHGHIELLVALSPCFCPFCVFDGDMDIVKRMAQFITNNAFQLHLHLHLAHVVAMKQPRTCPVPSCGPTMFDAFDLLTHMVVFHRVPICGSTKHIRRRQLRLPKREDMLTPMEEDDEEVGAENQQESQKPARKRSRMVIYDSSDDEEPEQTTAPVFDQQEGTSAAAGKRKRDDEDDYENEEDEEEEQVRPRRKHVKRTNRAADKTHYCTAHRLQFVDIRNHIPACCTSTTFRIRDKDVSRTKWGPTVVLADWLRTAPSEILVEPTEAQGARKQSVSVKSTKELRKYKCDGCKREYASIADHFKKIRSDKSKCSKRRFRKRQADGKFGAVSILAASSST